MTVPKILAIFVVLLVINLVGDGHRPGLPVDRGRAAARHRAISRLVHPSRRDRRPADRGPRGRPAGAQPQQICRLGLDVHLVRRVDLPVEHGLFEPALHLCGEPERAAERLRRRGQLLEGRADAAVLLGVLRADPRASIAHLLWPRGTDLGLKVRLARAVRQRPLAPLAIAGVAAVAMAATGAYAYHNIKTLNRYETSDEAESLSRRLRAQISQI